jgi:hypothetical protein
VAYLSKMPLNYARVLIVSYNVEYTAQRVAGRVWRDEFCDSLLISH